MVDYVPETEKIDAACISQPFFYQQFVAKLFLYSFITLAAVTQKIFRKSKTCTWNALYVDKRQKNPLLGKSHNQSTTPQENSPKFICTWKGPFMEFPSHGNASCSTGSS